MMALNLSKEQIEKAKKAIKFSSEHEELFVVGLKMQRLENKLCLLLERDPEYVKERNELFRQLREKYAQKYINEGLL